MAQALRTTGPPISTKCQESLRLQSDVLCTCRWPRVELADSRPEKLWHRAERSPPDPPASRSARPRTALLRAAASQQPREPGPPPVRWQSAQVLDRERAAAP